MLVYRCRSPTNLVLGQTYLKQLIYKVVESERYLKFLNLTFLCLIFLVGCATPQIKVIDPTGRLLPMPHYTLQPIGHPIITTFYYTSFEEIQDVDGTVVKIPTYLSVYDLHKLDANKYKEITLTVEIYNPKRIEYSLYENLSVKYQDRKDTIQSGQPLNSSNMEYRQFAYDLPIGEKITEVTQFVVLSIDKTEVVRIGDFRYKVNY